MAKPGSGNNRMLKKAELLEYNIHIKYQHQGPFLIKILHFPTRFGYLPSMSMLHILARQKNFIKQHLKVFAGIADTKGQNVVFMIYLM